MISHFEFPFVFRWRGPNGPYTPESGCRPFAPAWKRAWKVAEEAWLTHNR
jgi:hypothetical protein